MDELSVLGGGGDQRHVGRAFLAAAHSHEDVHGAMHALEERREALRLDGVVAL